jgi:hypothetical protein
MPAVYLGLERDHMNEIVKQRAHKSPGWAEVDPTQPTVRRSAEEKKELKKKNLVVGLALLVFVGLVFFVTIAKLTANFAG